jgi:UDP-N-acetylmuramate--alanine ligase
MEDRSRDKYHLVGIGGIGMSGLAHILLEQKAAVSGSDAAMNDRIEQLQKKGARITLGHEASNVPVDAALVYSTDIPEHNCELEFARKLKMPILHRSDLLKVLMKGYYPLLVAGTHGKTTTASLLTSVLLKMGCDPSYAIGGELAASGLNASCGIGNYFVAEADESDGTFLKYDPYGAIITNVDNDHMNHYHTQDNLCDAFQTFGKKAAVKELLFYCMDDPFLQKMSLEGTSYGFSPESLCRGSRFFQKERSFCFDAELEGKKYPSIEISLLGYHNALNALAVFGLSLKIGIPEMIIRAALKGFKGVKRRTERIGEIKNILVLDDYGHHPTEIYATLKGVKNSLPNKRLVVLFQPHRFTRTRDCLKQFGSCFTYADEVLVTDIYSANEPELPGIDALSLAGQVRSQSTVSIQYVPKVALVPTVLQLVRENDVVITLGAGDIYKAGLTLLNQLQGL